MAQAYREGFRSHTHRVILQACEARHCAVVDEHAHAAHDGGDVAQLLGGRACGGEQQQQQQQHTAPVWFMIEVMFETPGTSECGWWLTPGKLPKACSRMRYEI